MSKVRIGVLATHPIQYQAPLFRALAKDRRVDLRVYFCHDHGVRPSFDKGFGLEIQYDVPLLDGYRYEFLPNRHPAPELSPSKLINPSILKALKREEALIVHGYSYPTALLALLGPHRRAKVLLRGDSNPANPRPMVKRATKEVLLRMIFARVDHFLAAGSLNAAYYRSYGVPEERISIAPFSVDDSLFSAPLCRDPRYVRATRRNFGLPEDGFLVLFVGKLIPKKRPQDIVAAMQRIPCDDGIIAAFVGAGQLENALRAEIDRQQLGGRVYFLGFRNQTELPRLYQCADALAVPSSIEPWGLVVNEAMAAGAVPIVSDRVGCGPDLVDVSRIYPVGDTSALASIVRRMVRDPDWFERQRRGSRACIERWRINDTAEAITRAVSGLIENSRPSKYSVLA